MISAIVITWNRCELLRQTLESLTRLVVPAGEDWELIVVDNNSTDRTAQTVDEFAARLPIRRIVEPVAGASRARNTGAKNTQGDLLLFTDDDVVVDPGWMAGHVAGAAAWPQAWYFAGPIRPRFDPGVPRWVERHRDALQGMLSARDLGPESRLLQPREIPWGPNMAIRRIAFAHSAFAEDMGRIGKRQMRGSEDSFFLPLEQQGAVGAWIPGASLQHVIPRSRANLRHLLRYYYGTGRAGARLQGAGIDPPRKLWRNWRRGVGRLVASGSNWPGELANVVKRTGRLVESRRLTRRGDSA